MIITPSQNERVFYFKIIAKNFIYIQISHLD